MPSGRPPPGGGGSRGQRAEVLVRDHDHHRGAQPRRVREGDADAVPAGEDADDAQTDVRVLRDAAEARALRGARESVLGLALLLLAQPLSGVLDLDADAVRDLLARDDDRLGGRRVAGGVVQEVGEDQREVVHHAAVDAEFGQVAYVDPVEVLDPADAAADHAEQALRLLPLPAGPVGAAEDGDAGGETVGGADRLVELHQAPGDGGQPAVLALEVVQTAAELAGQDVDAAADADHGVLGGGRAVELLLDADQRRAQDLAQVCLQLGADLRALVDARQDVVNGLALAQLAQRLGQLLVGEPDDCGELVGQLLLPDLGLVGELGLVGLGLGGDPLLVGGALLGQALLVGAGLLGQLRLIGAGLLDEPVLQGAALGAVLPLQAGDVLLPLL